MNTLFQLLVGRTERGTTLRVGALCLVVLIGVEALITTFERPNVGLAAYSVSLILLFGLVYLFWNRKLYQLLSALALLPVVRILNLGLPLTEFSQLFRYLLISVPMIGAALMARGLLRLPRREVGLTLQRPLLQVLIMLSGLPLGIGAYLLIEPDPLVIPSRQFDAALAALVLLIGSGFADEFVFRGVLQRAAVNTLGSFGIVFAAAAYATLYIGYQLPVVLFFFAVSIFWGFCAQRTGSILGTALAHWVLSVTLLFIMPFLQRGLA